MIIQINDHTPPCIVETIISLLDELCVEYAIEPLNDKEMQEFASVLRLVKCGATHSDVCTMVADIYARKDADFDYSSFLELCGVEK